MINLKSAIRRALPQSAIEGARYVLMTLPRTLEKSQTRRVFSAAPKSPEYLDYPLLEALEDKYPPVAEYGYSPEIVESRGVDRAIQLLRLPGAKAATSFLELGCWDGMVSAALCARGKTCTAIDALPDGFDDRAKKQGARLLCMDAAKMDFEDNAFDFLFSYDAFEHFASPESVLQEAIRVVKPGGHIYLEFGPLYFSAFGEHAYRSVRVPYCQFLFSKSTIEKFTAANGLTPIDWGHVNRLSLQDYRNLWRKYAPQLNRLRYIESANLAHLDLIRSYPSCFASKSDDFENFTISSMSVLFQKI